MPKKATSSRISTLAAKLHALLPDRIPGESERDYYISDWVRGFYVVIPLKDLRSVLMSLISQDETRGQKAKRRATRKARK